MTDLSEDIADLKAELALSRESNDELRTAFQNLKLRMVIQGLITALLYIPLQGLAVYVAIRLASRRKSTKGL